MGIRRALGAKPSTILLQFFSGSRLNYLLACGLGSEWCSASPN
ncbi:hypothetical protein [Syntrophaceticus schinkii]